MRKGLRGSLERTQREEEDIWTTMMMMGRWRRHRSGGKLDVKGRRKGFCTGVKEKDATFMEPKMKKTKEGKNEITTLSTCGITSLSRRSLWKCLLSDSFH